MVRSMSTEKPRANWRYAAGSVSASERRIGERVQAATQDAHSSSHQTTMTLGNRSRRQASSTSDAGSGSEAFQISPNTRHGIQSRAGRRDTFGCADLEFLPAQIFLKQIPHLGFVIDDQNVRLVRHNRSPTTVNFHSPHEGPDCSTVGEAACVSER